MRFPGLRRLAAIVLALQGSGRLERVGLQWDPTVHVASTRVVDCHREWGIRQERRTLRYTTS